MASVNTYLNFNGNCEEAFNFYKSVFGGEFGYLGRFNEIPEGSGKPASEEAGNQIMHVSLQIGNTYIMGSDVGEEWAPNFKQGNNFSVSINADSKEEADRFFDGLSEGGKVILPMNRMFWGDYFGMFEDKFGVNWMVSFNEKKA